MTSRYPSSFPTQIPTSGREIHGQSDSGHAFATVSDVIAGGVFSNATTSSARTTTSRPMPLRVGRSTPWVQQPRPALPGPLAVAGSIGQTGQTSRKPVRLPHQRSSSRRAAAVGSPKTATPTTAALRTGKKTAAPAAATALRERPPAAASGRGSSKK